MCFQKFVVLLVIYCVLASGQEAGKGCKLQDGRVAKVGEQVDMPGHCNLHKCLENGEWLIAACGALGVPFGWSATPEDTSETAKYPDCCAKLIGPQEIVPDVLDELPGTEYTEITWGGNITASVGNELTPTQVKAEPKVNFTFWADPKAYYLLIMTGPDAPSRQNPEAREFLYWMVGNIPGDNKSGDAIAEYVSPGPPKGSGLHRYFFLLFQQPGKLSFDDEPYINKNSVGWRRKFSTRNFAKKYSLGKPKSVNVYLAQYDDYVPEVHKQLGFNPPKFD